MCLIQHLSGDNFPDYYLTQHIKKRMIRTKLPDLFAFRILMIISGFFKLCISGPVPIICIKTEKELYNTLGYRLIERGRLREAIEIFKLNVTEHLESWNVYDCLGEAYITNGDEELAIQNYRKSLDLNPVAYACSTGYTGKIANYRPIYF